MRRTLSFLTPSENGWPLGGIEPSARHEKAGVNDGPEQAQGLPADVRSDIYSLGVVLFETFAGTLPFKGDTIMSIVMGHIQKPPPRPRSINPRVPADLEALILRCLEKDPAKRFPQVGNIQDALTAISSTVEAA